MNSERDFHRFNSTQEKIKYLRRYGIIAPTSKKIPTLYYVERGKVIQCELLGYEHDYDTFSIAVIDYGEGPHFIHIDYFRDMQYSLERNKGNRILVLPDEYVIFDLETTDINVRVAEVIQIAAIRISQGEIIDTFSTLVKPQNPIPQSVTRLTGITDLDVCFAPDIQSVLPQFLEFIGDSVLAGYNIHTYDTNIIYDLCRNLLKKDFTNNYFDYYLYFKNELTKSQVPNYKLTTVASYFGIDTSSAHDAFEDCKLCLGCYEAMNLKDEIKEDSIADIGNVNNINTDFERALLDLLNEIISAEELPANSLYLYSNCSLKGKNKGKEISKSICIHEPEYPANPNAVDAIGKNSVVLRFAENSGIVELYIKECQYTQIKCPTANVTGKDIKVVSFPVTDSNIFAYIRDNVLYCLKHYHSNNSFSCCSRFIQCSDALKCVHENKLYATGCTYRRNLENGRVFYGKNRNVD